MSGAGAGAARPGSMGFTVGNRGRAGARPFRDRGRDAHEHRPTPPVRATAPERRAAARGRPAAAIHAAVATAA